MISKLYLAFFCFVGLLLVKHIQLSAQPRLQVIIAWYYEFGVAIEKPTAIGEYNHYEVSMGDQLVSQVSSSLLSIEIYLGLGLFYWQIY